MPESHVVSGLKAKRDEVKRAIRNNEQKIKTARADRATLNEALAIFGEFSGNPKKYFERRQLLERGELMRIIMDAFKDTPDGLTTRDRPSLRWKQRASIAMTISYSPALPIALAMRWQGIGEPSR